MKPSDIRKLLSAENRRSISLEEGGEKKRRIINRKKCDAIPRSCKATVSVAALLFSNCTPFYPIYRQTILCSWLPAYSCMYY